MRNCPTHVGNIFCKWPRNHSFILHRSYTFHVRICHCAKAARDNMSTNEPAHVSINLYGHQKRIRFHRILIRHKISFFYWFFQSLKMFKKPFLAYRLYLKKKKRQWAGFDSLVAFCSHLKKKPQALGRERETNVKWLAIPPSFGNRNARWDTGCPVKFKFQINEKCVLV